MTASDINKVPYLRIDTWYNLFGLAMPERCGADATQRMRVPELPDEDAKPLGGTFVPILDRAAAGTKFGADRNHLSQEGIRAKLC
eukprot:5037213-Pyramimonas_sp.AAC.1